MEVVGWVLFVMWVGFFGLFVFTAFVPMVMHFWVEWPSIVQRREEKRHVLRMARARMSADLAKAEEERASLADRDRGRA